MPSSMARASFWRRHTNSMRKLGYLLFSVLAMVHTQAKISGSNVPYIYPEHAQVQAKLHPAKITHANPNSIYDQVSLETVARPGNAHSPGWTSPKEGEGSMLDITGNGFREPINVIISGHSDLSVLSEHGLLNYVRSIGFSFECLHLHLGGLQFANLGDGHGWQPQLFEYRSLIYPGSLGVWLGSCWESLAGGNHFRVWKQNGSLADTGAWFLAVSKEESVAEKHTIIPNGYDLGRDQLVQAAKRGGSFSGASWYATVDWQPDLIPRGIRSM